jgi:hypothetical protein
MVAFQGGHPPFKGDSPYLRPQPSWAESSPTRSKVLPYGAGAGPHASCKPAQGGRSQTAARGACNRPAVTSVPPLSPRPAGERADSHAGGMQPRQVGAPLRLPARPAWRPRPTRHATGASDATCEQPHRHLRHCHASSTAEPVPRLEATLRMTQQRQPAAHWRHHVRRPPRATWRFPPLLLVERRRRGVCKKVESVPDRPLALCRGSGAA